jgi:hypothetical protein
MAALDQPLDAAASVAAGVAVSIHPAAEADAAAVAIGRHAGARPALARWIARSAGEVDGLDMEDAAALEAAAQKATLQAPKETRT